MICFKQTRLPEGWHYMVVFTIQSCRCFVRLNYGWWNCSQISIHRLCYVVACCVMLYRVVLCDVLCCAVLYHMVLYHMSLRYDIWGYDISCHVMWCHGMLRYHMIMLHHVIFMCTSMSMFMLWYEDILYVCVTLSLCVGYPRSTVAYVVVGNWVVCHGMLSYVCHAIPASDVGVLGRGTRTGIYIYIYI